MKWKKRRENIYDKAEGKVCQSKKWKWSGNIK
jgi:hypothetical protein